VLCFAADSTVVVAPPLIDPMDPPSCSAAWLRWSGDACQNLDKIPRAGTSIIYPSVFKPVMCVPWVPPVAPARHMLASQLCDHAPPAYMPLTLELGIAPPAPTNINVQLLSRFHLRARQEYDYFHKDMESVAAELEIPIKVLTQLVGMCAHMRCSAAYTQFSCLLVLQETKLV
jgi:hypothetical protein